MTTWMARLLLFVISGMIAMLATDVSGKPPAPHRAEEPASLTVAEVYQKADQSLRHPGIVYHGTIKLDADLGFVAYSGTVRQWADANRNAARQELDNSQFGRSAHITTGEARYVQERSGRFTVTSGQSWVCHDAGVAASTVLGCPGPTEQSTTEVRQGEYAGRPVLILLTTGMSSGSDERLTFTRRLYVDPDSFLPIAMETDGQVDYGQVSPMRVRQVYQHEFLPADGLPADFFDPAAIGYVPTDPEAPLNQSMDLTVFWLGSRFPGSGALPPLVLANTHTPTSSGGPGYRFILDYALTDDPFGPRAVTLQIWQRAAWDAFLGQSKGGHIWDDPCWRREQLTLPGGRATLFSGFMSHEARTPSGPPPGAKECPSRSYDLFLAHAYFGETIVFASAPGSSGSRGTVTSPYNTYEGMEAIVRALQPRQR